MRMSSCSLPVPFGAGRAATVGRAIGLAALLGAMVLAGCATPALEGVETGQTGRDGAGALAIPVPPGEPGELLVAVLGIKANPNIQGPEGWTPIAGFEGFNGALCGADSEGVSCQLSIFYKVTDGSDTDATFSWGSRRHAAGAVLRYSNIDSLAPIGATATARGTSAAPTAPVVVTTRANSRVLRLTVVETDDARNFLVGSDVFTDAPNTVRFNVASFPAAADGDDGCGPPMADCSATDNAVALAGSDNRNGAPGGSGTADWEILGGDQWLAASIEIKLAAGS
ncbi:MAG: hypothetical protein OXH69_13945 [Acidobacteria bacterium]|nr:hypothetical protein [Acidobacteriota bacterium]